MTNVKAKQIKNILPSFSREVLRSIARVNNIPVGKDKDDTIASILKHNVEIQLSAA